MGGGCIEEHVFEVAGLVEADQILSVGGDFLI